MNPKYNAYRVHFLCPVGEKSLKIGYLHLALTMLYSRWLN